MSTAIDTQVSEAMTRLTTQINRSAGQHSRAIKRAFVTSRHRLEGSGAVRFEGSGSVVFIDPLREQKATAIYERLHGQAGVPLPDAVELYLKQEADTLRRMHAPQVTQLGLAPAQRQTPAAPAMQEPYDAWPVIGRIYLTLAAVGVLGVGAVFWDRF